MKRKRIIGWTAGIIFGLLVVLCVGGSFVLRSESFHRYVLAKIVQQGSEATGGKVEVGNFDFQFSTLTAHLYDFTIHGTEPSSARPLLHVKKLTVGLKILSVLHERVNLSELLIESPTVNLIVDKTGKTNIPEPNAPKTKSSQTNVFDLAVGHVLLSNGEIDYNDRKSAVDGDVRDLRAETHFSSLTKSYAGAISYHDGQIHYGGLTPLPHSLEAEFNATPAELRLSSLVLTVGSSRMALQANIGNYANPKIDGTYNIQIHTQDVANLTSAATPAGDVFLNGTITYQGEPNHSFLRDAMLDGKLRSEFLKVTAPQAHMELHNLTSRYQLANGNLKTDGFVVDLLGGRLTALLAIQSIDTTSNAKLNLAMSGISLEAARASLNNSSTKNVPLTGILQGVAAAAWRGNLQNLQARSDFNIRAAASKSGGTPAVPLNGAVHLAYDAPRNILTVRQTVIRTPHSSLVADGQLSDRSNLSVQANTSDLHELGMLASMLQSNAARNPKPFDLSGAANLNAIVTGTIKWPAIAARLNAQHFTVDRSEWSDLNLSAQASANEISIQKGSLTSVRQGQVSFSGKTGLRNWSYVSSNPIAINVSVKQMPATEIEQLAGLQYPVDGVLSGDMTLRGSQLNPSGNGNLRLTKAKIADEPFQTLAVQFNASNGSIHSSLNASLPAGSSSATLTFVPKTKAYKLEAHAPEIVLSKLQAFQNRNLPVEGTLTLSASGEGTLDNPNLTASAQIPQLRLRQNSINGVKAELGVINHRANILLNSDVAQSTIRARGTVDLAGDYFTVASIDSTKIPLEPLLAMFVPNHPTGFQGATELHATLKGPLKDKARIEAHVVIPTLNASYQTLQVGITKPIHVDYANSIIVIQPTEIKGTDSDLQFEGRMGIGNTDGTRAAAKGSVDLRLLQIFSPDVKSEGTLALDVHTEGPVNHPGVQGQVRLKEVSFYTASAPVGLGHANGVFDIDANQLRISQFTGQVGGGKVSAGGTVTYRPQVQFNVALEAKSVRLLYPEGLRTVLNSDLALAGNTTEATLEGRVLIDSLSFTPDFDMSSFMSQFTGPSVPPTSQSFADSVKLDVSIQSTSELAATSSQISLQGQANLRAIGTAANPVIVGRADLNSGDVFFLNNRYQIQRGVFTFNNPNQTEPAVNLAATTTIQQYNLTLNVNGTLDKLQTSYVSDPPLSTVDIINLIARGQTTQQADTTNLSANSLIAQGVASRLSSGVQKLAGLSSLSIDPLLSGNNGNPSARIAVQQRLSKNFFFTFSTDVTQPQSEVVQGEYQISKRWSVSANRDAAGGVAVDGKFHSNF